MSVSLGQGQGPESSASGNTQGDANRNGEGGEWLDERVAAISAEIAAAIAQAQAQAQEQIIEEEEESSSEEEIEGDEGEGEETNAENGDIEMRRGSNTAGIVNERNIIVNISGIPSSREEEDDDDDEEDDEDDEDEQGDEDPGETRGKKRRKVWRSLLYYATITAQLSMFTAT